MNKRICFVDDDPQALESLKRETSGIRGAWDCVFVASGPEALAAMAAEPFDAVVADLDLPGMSGAQLLRRVGELHPKTLRFVLGDVGEQELVISCIGGTHQFIARPCHAPDLMANLHRSLALEAWLASDQLRRLVPRLERLPSLPSTYFELLKQIESPDTDLESIGAVIVRDPAATARLLQVVNSAAMGLKEKVTDPLQAISLLGAETVKSLVLCLQVFNQHEQAEGTGLSFDHLWSHSVAVASTARQLASCQTGDARLASDAFTAGLLHDVGRIVLASNLPEDYSAIVAAAKQKAQPLEEAETAQLGVTHAQVGAYLLGLWGMPAALVEAAALHHHPSQALTREFSLLAAVHVANVLAHEEDPGNLGLPVPTLDAAYLEALGVLTSNDSWRAVLAGEEPPPPPVKAASAEAGPARGLSRTAAQPRFPSRNWLRQLWIPAAALLLVAGLWSWQSLPHAAAKSNARGPMLPVAVAQPAAPRRVMEPLPAEPTAVRQASATATVPLPGANPAPAPTRPGLMPTAAAGYAPASSPIQDQPDGAPRPPAAGPPTTPRSGFESVTIQGIFYRSENPSAIINGRALSRGDRINDLEVVSVERTQVILRWGNERRIYQMK